MKRASLQRRLTFLPIALFVGSLLLLAVYFARRDEALIVRQNTTLSRHLTETLAISITNALLYEELELIEEGGLVENYIDEWLRKKDLHVRYIHVTDKKGRVIASSDLREYGKTPDDSLSLAIDRSKETQVHHVLGAGREPILDVSTPLNISTRSWGHLRVGYSLQPLRAELRSIRESYFFVAVPLVALVSLLLALYIRRSFLPLKKLRDFVGQVPEQSWFRAPVTSYDEIGDLARSFNVMLDQLEQVREKEREAQERFHQAERIAVVGKLAAGVAHEVRNPLAGIGNLVENLERYKFNDEKFRQYTDTIRQGLQRIERTVEGLVSFAHQSPFNPVTINPFEVVEETLELIGYNLRKNKIDVRWVLPEILPKIHADGDQIRQVVLNIMLNAIQAMEESGGEMVIGIRPGEPGMVEVYIEDNGIGIPREKLKNIFDPFYTTQPVGKGTGLGLAVSKSIVERHGGRIDVISTEGKGTRFTLVLPAAHEHPVESSDAETPGEDRRS